MAESLIDLALAQGQIADAAEASTVREMTLSVGAPKDLRGLDAFPALEHLKLFAEKALSLRGIEPLLALRSLELGVPSVKDLEALDALPLRHLLVGAERQASLAGLRSRTLLGLDAAAIGLKTLEGLELPALRRLNVSMNKIADLAPLASLSALRNLNLQGNPAADLGPLAGHVEMRRLSLSGMRKVKDLGPLKQLRALAQLVLTGVAAKDRSAIAGLNADVLDGGATQGLPLRPWNEAVVRAGLAAEDELDQLAAVDSSGLYADGLAGVRALSGLRQASLAVSDFAEIEHLPSLIFLFVPMLGDASQRLDLSAVGRSPHLRRLNVRHPLQRAAELPPNPSVRHLFLNAPAEGAFSLDGIERFPQLLTLVVGGRTAPDLAPLDALPQLRILSLQVPEAKEEVEARKQRLLARA